MPLRIEDLLARRVEGYHFGYQDTQALLYNLTVGMGRDPLDLDELPFVLENPKLRVVPTFAAVLGGGTGTLLDGAGIDWRQVLHVGQALQLHAPLPAAARLVATSQVGSVVDRGEGRGALITLISEASSDDGVPLYRSETTILARGDGGCGEIGGKGLSPHVLPTRPADMVHMTETRPDHALFYRLNGDRNPLHADPAFAKAAGFERPILHGMCSFGIACRAVLACAADHDPAGVRSFQARFTKPCYPGETLETELWFDAEVISFRCIVAGRGAVVVDHGRCELTGARA